MGRIIRKTVVITLSWLILNAGVFGFIKVYSASGSKIGNGITAMARVEQLNDGGLSIELLGHEAVLNQQTVCDDQIKALTAAAAEPALIAAATAYELISGR